ncbi:hypothetical protein [Thermoleptolyngbya sp. M55_K2018_002]|uniref:hypothetical protein n=1 Tax=Thermoleptolyngbya sp. M55_K2018_002 TaxID=2747808 RepID=UPI0019E27873|nr:hypothetical protein [Thermoleptolyngbya sp. M55_K2018_002]HIK39789.1 hypothetical protein [Thermoleptolyngbya sp. M55_K2018_002]
MPRRHQKYLLGERIVIVLRCRAAACLVKVQGERGVYRFWVSRDLLTTPIALAEKTKKRINA